ncbi:transposon dosrupted ORF, Hypothetical protein [Francisella tularensis subsp. tularensis WY96-3418]|nr:transposon dosrupted ORF, Hypothetical protein [Francisella tularensis subsp. tularensis WY96-3418]ADA79319.1 transposon dosrupted ORF, Hypothetical protein [Francisella tularensis subsp. tularensis NE061598]
MKKLSVYTLVILLLNSCTLYDRDTISSSSPLVKRQQKTLFINKTQNNKKLFDFFNY